MSDEDDQEELSLIIKWSGQDYAIVMGPEETLAVLKRRLGGRDCLSMFDLACQLVHKM